MSNDESQGLNKIFPMNKGDNFMLGPHHFVCMGWKNGRVLAMTYRPHEGIFKYSFMPDVLLAPGFKMLKRAEEQT